MFRYDPIPMWKYKQDDLMGVMADELDLELGAEEVAYEIKKLEVLFVYDGIFYPTPDEKPVQINETGEIGPVIQAELNPAVLCEVLVNGEEPRTYFYNVVDIVDRIGRNQGVDYYYVETHGTNDVYEWEFIVICEL